MRNLLFTFLLLTPISSYGYIGPGMGAGAIAVILGILASIFLGFFAILWYPFKRLLRKRKKKQADKPKDESDPA